MQGQLTRAILNLLDAVAPQPKLPDHLKTGARGEEDAYFYLRRHGYIVVARNWRTRRRRGELDLVAWDGPTLCFIEVKTRTTRDVQPPEAAVNRAKMRELSAMAGEFCRRRPDSPPTRFDILSLYRERPESPPQITLFKNAFAMP